MKFLPLLLLLLLLLFTLATSIKTTTSAAVFSDRKINRDVIPKQQKGDAGAANTHHHPNTVRAVNEFGKASSGDGLAVGGKKDLDMSNHHSKDAASWSGIQNGGPSPDN